MIEPAPPDSRGGVIMRYYCCIMDLQEQISTSYDPDSSAYRLSWAPKDRTLSKGVYLFRHSLNS
ncbi:hypothetical protein GCM10010869_59050 [Mesorhizobium tianshanense]|nr:hypothetical protein GCM10010869_59050 [Mesorhizobium tianshanense]